MANKPKLTLGAGIESLKGIVQDVQPTDNKDSVVTNEENSSAFTSERERWNYFVAKATENSKGTAQTTVYIPSSLKEEIENLRNIEDLKKVPLSSLIATILDDFIVEHLSTIKELINEKKSRF